MEIEQLRELLSKYNVPKYIVFVFDGVNNIHIWDKNDLAPVIGCSRTTTNSNIAFNKSHSSSVASIKAYDTNNKYVPSIINDNGTTVTVSLDINGKKLPFTVTMFESVPNKFHTIDYKSLTKEEVDVEIETFILENIL